MALVDDVVLTTPDVERIATKARIHRASLTAQVPLVDDSGQLVRMFGMEINLNDQHPQAVRNKVEQSIIDMAVYLGVIPPQS